MYEDRTFDNLMAEALALAPPGIDTRQGSIFYDACVGNCMKLSEFYLDLNYSFQLVFIATAVGEYLDQLGWDYARLKRNSATSAVYEYRYEGTQPPIGEIFFTDAKYFDLEYGETGLQLRAQNPGIDGNSIIPGTNAVLYGRFGKVEGLKVSTFGNLLEPGVETESDDDFRRRIQEKLAGPAENGNRQHYKTWCESVAGVGRAYIISLFAGENTVMGVLVGADGKPAAQAVVDRVQEYVDPITKNVQWEYNGETIIVGDGTGDGRANIGAHFYAISAAEVPLAISFNAETASGFSLQEAQQQATEAIEAYLVGLALDSPAEQQVVVRMSAIGNLLYSLESIVDYSELTINGGTANIEIANTEVATLQEVVVNALVR